MNKIHIDTNHVFMIAQSKRSASVCALISYLGTTSPFNCKHIREPSSFEASEIPKGKDHEAKIESTKSFSMFSYIEGGGATKRLVTRGYSILVNDTLSTIDEANAGNKQRTPIICHCFGYKVFDKACLSIFLSIWQGRKADREYE